jgi:hypothetical protein
MPGGEMIGTRGSPPEDCVASKHKIINVIHKRTDHPSEPITKPPKRVLTTTINYGTTKTS